MGIVGIRQRNIIDSQIRQELETVEDLRKVNNASIGDIIRVMGYSSAGDGGGGLFRLVEANDFVSGAVVSEGAGEATRNLTINWPYGIERKQSLINHSGDQIQWAGGAVWTKNNSWDGPGELDWGSPLGWGGDAVKSVASGEKGYLIPKVEGFRVIPQYTGWNRTTIWERIVEDGVVTPEMFGATISDQLGTKGSGTDCTAAIQAAFDSPFNVRFNGGNYYIGSPVYIKYQKTIIGAGSDNTNPDPLRLPTLLSNRHITRIWTDQNVNLFNIQAVCHLEKIQFNVAQVPLGTYDKTILNYDMSFQNWGSSVWFCSFFGKPETVQGYTGKGGTAIRFNNDDADNTYTRRNNGIIGGWVCAWSSRKIYIEWMAIGHKIDAGRIGQVSDVTGEPINTFVNCTELDATYYGVKQAVRWLDGSVSTISGEYCQDAGCLPYAERDTPLFYLHCGQTTVDIGIGDQRITKPAVNDDVALGGSVTYPQPHYTGYNYDTTGGVSFAGRALRDYNWGYSRLKGNPSYAVDNYPFVSLDNVTGHSFWYKNFGKYSDATSWIDNQLLFADLRSTVTVSPLRSTASYNFDAATDELTGTFSAATGVTVSDTASLWTMTGVPIPTIAFGGGSDADNDFVEITLKDAVDQTNFIQRCAELLARIKIGCKQIQVITRTSGAVVDNYLIDVSSYSATVKPFRFPLTADNSKTKIIIRFIGSTGVNTEIQSLHLNTFTMPAYPFLPASGGTLLGGLTVPSLAFTSGSGFAPPERRTVVNISSADLLTGNSGGARQVIIGEWLNIRSIYFEVTGGTTDYATNTNLEFFQGSRFFPVFSVNLGSLPSNGRRVMIPVPVSNLQYGNEGISWQVQTGDPTAGNKAIRVVIDYTTGQPTS
jgi:hypothetical protein